MEERASNGVRDERDAGGGSGGGRMRRGVYGSMKRNIHIKRNFYFWNFLEMAVIPLK